MPFAKINHVAIVSERYALLTKFYETLFGMQGSKSGRSGRALTVRDGYVGLNINPRKAGRPSGLDHFGVEVQDVETVFERMKKYPQASYVKRPSTRPFAGITANDPDGNVFDLSQKDMANRSEVYVENEKEDGKGPADRHISHIGIRTMRPDEMAQFYSDVLELKVLNKKPGDPNQYLSDGRVTLVLIPWRIDNYLGTSILPTGPDHIGFTVENMEKLKEDLDEIVGVNPIFNPIPVGKGKESGTRLDLLKKQCPMGEFFMSDPDFTMLSVQERA
ncbi:MAG TPA: VOC family protein [Alphaproteobacteria bacterium]|jgi:catechol 2,3-dioxygenase-like lactoylglutathione lyase family enzyme